MSPSRCTLALLIFSLAACNPGCTAPEAEHPEANANKEQPPAGGGASGAAGQTGPTKVADSGSGNQADPGGSGGSGSGELIREAKGVDLKGLDENRKTSFFQLLNSESSACGKAESLAKSLRDDASCRDSLSVAQFIADALKAGHAPGDIKEAIDHVVDSLRPREIDITGSPIYGNPRAPVTIVVFADFECPHCREEAPKLRQVVDQYRGRAKLVFKHFPLSGHVRAKVAAFAVEAASAQGKFWEMNKLVFENQTALEDEDLMRYAQEIGLDMVKFKRDFESRSGQKRIDMDRALGEKLEISGTPAVFVNGRYYNDLMFGGSVAGWVDDALRR